MVVVVDKDADIQTAKYVIIKDSEKTSDNKVGIVKSVVLNKLGDYEVTLETEDGKETAIVESGEEYRNIKEHEDGVAVYTTETNKNDEKEFNFVKGITYAELDDANTDHGYVSAVDGDLFTVKNAGAGTYSLTSKTLTDAWEDATIVIVEVTEVKGDAGQYEVDSIETVDLDDLTLVVGDRISLGKDGDDVLAVFVIRNMTEIED